MDNLDWLLDQCPYTGTARRRKHHTMECEPCRLLEDIRALSSEGARLTTFYEKAYCAKVDGQNYCCNCGFWEEDGCLKAAVSGRRDD